MKKSRRIWLLWALGSVLLCSMTWLITMLIWIVHTTTGLSLWVQVKQVPELSEMLEWIGLLPFFLIGNWPLVLMPLWIYGYMESYWVRHAVIGALSAMAVGNVLFWIATPAEIFSDAPDRGQGTGLAIIYLVVASPFLSTIGWFFGRLIGQGEQRLKKQ